MGLLGLGRGGRLPGADGPDRLVGDHEARRAAGAAGGRSRTCRSSTARVCPASRSCSVSPTQTMQVSPWPGRPRSSCPRWRRSRRKTAGARSGRRCTWLHPRSASIGTATSPVKAPFLLPVQSWAPTAMRRTLGRLHRRREGGKRAGRPDLHVLRRPSPARAGSGSSPLPAGRLVHLPVAGDHRNPHASLLSIRSDGGS